MKTDRELALEWWNGLFYNQQQDYNLKINGKFLDWLNNDQIEEIWRKETQQNSIDNYSDLGDEMFALPKKEPQQKQVDFVNLKDTLEILSTTSLLEDLLSSEDQINLGLFLELLSKSSTFAHKAHKELNKLK